MKKNISKEVRVMDISLNLARVGNWTADSYDSKKTLIEVFLKQTEGYLEELKKQKLSSSIVPVIALFEKEFDKLRSEKGDNFDKYNWAERALTWANILQHKAKLA